MTKAKPVDSGRFRTLKDNLSHGDHNHALGSVVDCLPEKSIPWMLACGWIEATDAPLGEPDMEGVTDGD